MKRPTKGFGRFFMNIKQWTSLGLIFLLGFILTAWAENKGAEKILIQGGASGNIDFPHHKHQNTLSDCNICHAQFPQNSGAIDSLKKSGKLEKKGVMNTCLKCHRDMAKAGKKTGPTSCKQCHSIKG